MGRRSCAVIYAPWRGIWDRPWSGAPVTSGPNVTDQANAIKDFFLLPDVHQLLTIARSDNALVALDVQHREVSWTKFMAWLLDPARQGQELAASRLQGLVHLAQNKLPDETGEAIGQQYLGRLKALVDQPVVSVLEVKPEDSAKQSGRLDLMVRCEIGAGETVRLLIENKIGASEHDEQLSGYVRHHHPIAGGDVLLPVLLEIGDEPAGSSTCTWAACLDRSDAAMWLGSLESCPAIARDYLAVFDAWNLAARLRVEQRLAIEVIRELPGKHPEWTLIESWLVANEIPFYLEALEHPELTRVLKKNRFAEPETLGRMKSDHDMLKLTKPGWTLYPCGDDAEGVQIHLECDGRGKMRLDIEIFPYEGSIAKKPGRLKELKRQLVFKARLHHLVRAALDGGEFGPVVTVSTRGRQNPDLPSTNSAGRFESGLTSDCTPDQHALYMASVIKAVSPLIDSAAKNAQGWLQNGST